MTKPAPPQIDPATFKPTMPRAVGHQHGLKKIPAGFNRFRGKKNPVDPRHSGDPIPDPNNNAYLELVIRTVDGFSTAGPRLVHPEEWNIPASELGSIAAYRRVGVPGEEK